MSKHYETLPGARWAKIKRGEIQRRIEDHISKRIPNLFVLGPPTKPDVDVRFAFNWEFGIFRIYAPVGRVGKMTAPQLVVVRFVRSRYPNIRVQVHDYDLNTKFPSDADGLV